MQLRKYFLFTSASAFTVIHSIMMLMLVFNLSACKKFVEVDPPITQLESSTVFTSDQTAIAAITGIYSNMMQTSDGFGSGGSGSITVTSALYADELEYINISSDIRQFYSSAVDPNNAHLASMWGALYKTIYSANAAIEGLTDATGVSNAVRGQLMGEARFIRAFSSFYLANLFGDVPVITVTDYRTNAAQSRLPVQQVYQQVIADLKEAVNQLPADYTHANNERTRPNKWAAAALLARVYLYAGDWVRAEAEATSVIEHSALYNLESDLNNSFLANATEAIWQLAPVLPNYNTFEGDLFILNDAPSFVALSNHQLEAFETGDARRSSWIDSIVVSGTAHYFPFKYKVKIGPPVTEYSMVLRLAEQYLIRAEARAQQNNVAGAQSDLNVIRSRAGLGNTPADDQATLLEATMRERRAELFTEWGHRWFDLKRANQAESVLSALKPDWRPASLLYPIPQSEILANAALSQNSGY